MINGHGDDRYRYDDLVQMNFSSTIYQHADHSMLKEYLAEHIDVLTNYPESQPKQLEKLIAQQLGISPESVMVTNGATEAIYIIAQLFRHSCSIIPQPTYSEYADACRLNKHIITYESGNDITDLPKDRVYWVCNPNNPSGNVLKKGFVDYVVRRSPRYTFVIDQSYGTFTKEPLLEARDMQGLPNVILIHSLSRKYSVPGLRLGYITAHPSTILLLRALRHPWSIPALSIEAGKFLIEQGQPVVSDLDAYLAETQRLRSELRKIEGMRIFETKTNYMLCELDGITGAALKNHLVHEHGMLIRDCYNFYGLSRGHFRISTQLPEENDALVAAIRQYVDSEKQKE
jgi:threonine-phosphate decarboxylase